MDPVYLVRGGKLVVTEGADLPPAFLPARATLESEADRKGIRSVISSNGLRAEEISLLDWVEDPGGSQQAAQKGNLSPASIALWR